MDNSDCFINPSQHRQQTLGQIFHTGCSVLNVQERIFSTIKLVCIHRVLQKLKKKDLTATKLHISLVTNTYRIILNKRISAVLEQKRSSLLLTPESGGV